MELCVHFLCNILEILCCIAIYIISRRNGENFNLVGSWCSSTRYIEVSNDECTLTGYEEFAPDFTENDPLIPYTKAEELMEKLRKEKMKDD